MALVIPTPREVFGAARAATSWALTTALTTALDTAVAVAVLPVRVVTVLGDVEQVIARIGEVVVEAGGVVVDARAVVAEVRQVADGAARAVASAERAVASAERAVASAERAVTSAVGVVGRADRTVSEAAEVTAAANRTVTDAAHTVAELAHTAQAATAMLTAWQPIAERAAPLASRVIRELSAEDLEVAIRAVGELPALTAHLREDLMPLLATLDRAGPDVHELLDVAKDVREAMAGIPGFTFLRRRGEHRVD